MYNLLKNKPILFYLPIALLSIFSCILIGLSFYMGSIVFEIPDVAGRDPTDSVSEELLKIIGDSNTAVNYISDVMGTILGLLSVSLFISLIILLTLLFFWGKDRKKMSSWREIGFFCDRLEFIGNNRIRVNQTEVILNKAQYNTLHNLVVSRLKGEPLHSIEMGENATQVIKRLREELGSKLIEKTLIMNHRGKGYWIEINPDRVKGIKSE